MKICGENVPFYSKDKKLNLLNLNVKNKTLGKGKSQNSSYKLSQNSSNEAERW